MSNPTPDANPAARGVLPTLSAKLVFFIGKLREGNKKYVIVPLLAALLMSFSIAFAAPDAGVARTASESILHTLDQDTVPAPSKRIRTPRAARRNASAKQADTLENMPLLDTLRSVVRDSLTSAPILSDTEIPLPAADSAAKQPPKSFLDDIIDGKNQDSLVYDVRNKQVHIYTKGELKYQNMDLKADYMRLTMDNKELFAHGVTDTAGVKSRPEFTQGGSNYTMDTITYNMKSGKAKIKGAATKDGEGYLLGRSIKKMDDNTINIAHGKYTTCDHIEHPHFYLAMTKAKFIPGKKVITGPVYFVMEDVPIYFLGVPGMFFPMSSGPKSGFIMPSYGEEYSRGFFLRDGGYYFKFGDYADLKLLGGIYTLGSWEASASSNYVVRYKFRGSLAAHYARTVLGEQGAADRMNQGSFKLTWTHQQDPKFRPNSTFSASVNFSTSGYTKYGSTTLNDYLNTQTNSSISYSKNWVGTPFSFSTNMSHSQNSRDSTISLSFPNAVLSMSRIYPFKKKNYIGKQRWYHKISLTYTGSLTNSVTAKERDLFTRQTLDDMKNGVQHSIPVSASWTILKYINVTPSFNYNARWFFKKTRREWDPATRTLQTLDPEYGFYHVHNYSMSGSLSTKIYAMFTLSKGLARKYPDFFMKAVRLVVTPTVSFSYAPDFSKLKYGYYDVVQSDSTGGFQTYSPYSGNAYGVPGSGRSGSLSFSVANTLEMKVRSRKDTSGVKKIKILDNFSFSGSYNFLADSINLSDISLNLRTTIYGNFGLNISATLDMYQVDSRGRKINKFNIGHGKFGRIARTGWSFGYTFNSKKSDRPAVNDINSQNFIDAYVNPFNTEYQMDPALRRQMMVSTYYDFSIPWNLGFNYSLSYQNNGLKKTVTQTLGFNGSLNLTPKWGISFNGGFDFVTKKITPGVITLTRDLHCWQMSFNWVPIGFRQSWSFNIGVKSAMLADLKYDKSMSNYDAIAD